MDTPPKHPETRPLRVALHYWGTRGGGPQFTLFLAQHLANTGVPIDILFCLACRNDEMAAFQATGLPIVTWDRPTLRTVWRQGWKLPADLKAQASALADFKPDAVVMTMNSPFAWPFVRLLQRRGLKVIYVAHDAEPHPGDYARLWQQVTQDLLVKQADRVVVLSTNVADRLSARIPAARDKISVIPLETVFPTLRPALPDTEEPIRLLSYGRLLPYKGLDVLAEALEPLRSATNWTLTIAGSGPLEGEVRRLFGSWPQVKLELGWVSEPRMAELFSTHHILLCPYNEASQSGAVATALSWAMPSIVMPTGALPEQVGQGRAGIVADTMDAEGFRKAVEAVLKDAASLRQLSEGAAGLLKERRDSRDWTRLIGTT